MYLIIKTLVSALVIVAVSEIAKKYTWAAAVIVLHLSGFILTQKTLKK